MDHDKLLSMLKGTDYALVLSRGAKLQQAGGVLKELSEALKSHLGKVTWEGQAAESFKTWAGNLQQSAEKLGTYSAGAGDAMNQAGEALSTAKAAVPPVPPDARDWVIGRQKQKAPDPEVVKQLKMVGWRPGGPSTAEIDAAMKRSVGDKNWISETQAMAGTKELYDARQEAIRQMEKLGEAYAAATTTLTGLGDNVVLPGTPETNRETSSDYSNGGSSGGSSGGALPSPRYNGGSVRGSSHPSVANYGGGSMTPGDPGTSWQEVPNSGHSGVTPPHGGGQLPPAPQDPGSSIPPSHPSDPVNRPGTGLDSIPTLPDQTVPVGPGSGPVLPGGPSGNPTYPGGPDGPVGLPGLPGSGPISGFPAGTGGGPVPAKGVGGIPGKGGGPVPARTGPFGGGPVPGKSGTPGLPSGTVFGREGAPGGGRVGGTPMGGGMGMHPGIGGGHGVVGGGGSSRGRGLTSTPGGTIGGRKGPAVGGEFTPGGTGLRNRAAAAGASEGGARSGQNGMMAPGMGGHGSRNERDRRSRADYLHEDEETWTSGTPHSNPDVIE
ncbi:WXG100 family type VII secretion target [Kitasatospora sp. NPDC018058]|uniref:WXG100 family type VII secretion target n=1 Tax=Kitasatospora sp. NPDC018058 TaxID=3364025 RepID=UPI0037C06C7E